MDRRRTREEIIYDILSLAADGPVILSKIMSRAGLTTVQTNGYLDYALENGLLKKEIANKSTQYHYRTTPKGMVYLHVVSSIRDSLPNRQGD